MQTTVGTDGDREIKILCGSIQRLLRMAMSDWYGYLATQSLNSDSWNDHVPWWAKKVPSRLDMSWALNDLHGSLYRPGMLQSLSSTVVDIDLSAKRDADSLNYPPNMDKLNDAIDSLCEKAGGLDVLGV